MAAADTRWREKQQRKNAGRRLTAIPFVGIYCRLSRSHGRIVNKDDALHLRAHAMQLVPLLLVEGALLFHGVPA